MYSCNFASELAHRDFHNLDHRVFNVIKRGIDEIPDVVIQAALNR